MQIELTTDRPLTYGDVLEVSELADRFKVSVNFDSRVNISHGGQKFTVRANPVRLFRFMREMRYTQIAK